MTRGWNATLGADRQRVGASRPRGPSSTSARYRHPGDVFRVVTGSVVLALLSVLAAGGVLTRPERDVFRLLNDLPDSVDGLVRVVTQAGWIGAVPIAAAVAALAHRRRLAVNLALAGSAAWVLAKVVKDIAHRGRPGVLLQEVILRGVPATGHGFVSGHAAVAAALATVASSEVSRPTRRVLWTLVWGVAAARLYSGAHLPLDVLGGVALGWALGAGVHLLRGTPGHAPTVATVLDGLTRAGVQVDWIRPLHADARGSVPFVGEGPHGAVFVKAVGPDQRDADLLFRTGRWLAFREVGDEAPLATAKQQIEHEAYLLLAAARAGARVPDLLATVEADRGTWLLAEQRVPGRDASEVAPLSDDALADIWRQVTALRTARIAHRDLRLANVVIGAEDKAWLIDFGFAQAGATDDQLARDVAELLASTANAVGADRAVAAALQAVGVSVLREAAPLLQPLALSTATRRLAARSGTLEELGEAMRSAGAPVDPRRLLRVRLRPAMLVAVAAGGYVTHHLLVDAVGASTVASLLGGSRWRWVALAGVSGFLPFVFAALALSAAAGRSLALGRTVAAQLASTLASRGSPSRHAGTELTTAYLCAAGMRPGDSQDAVGLTRAAGLAVHTVTMAAAAAWAVAEGLRLAEPPRPAALILVALGVGLFVGGAGWLPASRRALVRLAVRRLRLLRRLRADTRTARLLLAQIAMSASFALSFLAALRSVSVSVPIAAAVTLYLVSSAFAVGAPLPGGLGIVEPALAAGLMVLGVPAASAVSSVVVFRGVTYWLPLVPAAFAFRRLRQQGCC